MKVIYNSVIGHSEDGSVGIFVNGDDRFRTLHRCHMLEGATDADCNVNLGFDGFPQRFLLVVLSVTNFDPPPAVNKQGPA